MYQMALERNSSSALEKVYVYAHAEQAPVEESQGGPAVAAAIGSDLSVEMLGTEREE